MMAAGPFGVSAPIGIAGYYLIERNYKVKVTKGQDRIRSMYKDVEGHNPRIELIRRAKEPCTICNGFESVGENFFATRGMPTVNSCLLPILSLFQTGPEETPPKPSTSQRSLGGIPSDLTESRKIGMVSADMKQASSDAVALANNLMGAYELAKTSQSNARSIASQGYVEAAVNGMMRFQNDENVHESAFLLLSSLISFDRGDLVSRSGAVMMVQEMLERRPNWYGAALAAKIFVERMSIFQTGVADFWANRGICDVLFKVMVAKFEPRMCETTFRTIAAILENCPPKTRMKLQNYLKRAQLLESTGKAMSLNMRRPEVLTQALRLITALHIGNIEILTYSMTKNLCDPVVQAMAAHPDDDHLLAHGKAIVQILVTPFEYDVMMKTMTALITQKV